ncbi:MAG: flagellin [Deltaproteobacteria bacterium]|nr:flagellin [Deltaproteobacteria bacterium]
MGLVINTNVASINAQRNLGKTEQSLNTSLARLSSGMRITVAKDDAAGLAISEKLRAQIRGLGQASRNANDGISLVQTAEGALNEVSNILIRMRELSVQAATGTLGDTERGYLQNEFDQLSQEIDRIAQVTEFNGTPLLDGSASVSLQVGINNNASDRIDVAIGSISTADLGIGSTDISTALGGQGALDDLDSALSIVSQTRGELGAIQNRLATTINNLQTQQENLSAANSRIRDVDVAAETVEMTRSQILMQAGVAVLAQANQMPAMALQLIGG